MEIFLKQSISIKSKFLDSCTFERDPDLGTPIKRKLSYCPIKVWLIHNFIWFNLDLLLIFPNDSSRTYKSLMHIGPDQFQ